MPKFNLAVDHGIDRDDAVRRLKSFSDKVKQDAPVDLTDAEEHWDEQGNLSFAFKAMGMKISGTMETCSSAVTVSGQIPFAAIPFRGQIEKQLASKILEALSEPVE